MKLRSFAFATLITASLASSGAAFATLSASGTRSVTFTAAGPGGMKIVGTTADLNATSTADTITVTVPLAHLTTGISLRDAHMRDKYLQVQTYPDAVLTVPRASIVFPAAGAQQEADATGTLALHGQTKPATFHYAARRDGQTYSVSGTVHVNMHDFGIDVPVYLGVGVKPDVDVAVRFDAKDDA